MPQNGGRHVRQRLYPESRPLRGTHTGNMSRESHATPGFSKELVLREALELQGLLDAGGLIGSGMELCRPGEGFTAPVTIHHWGFESGVLEDGGAFPFVIPAFGQLAGGFLEADNFDSGGIFVDTPLPGYTSGDSIVVEATIRNDGSPDIFLYIEWYSDSGASGGLGTEVVGAAVSGLGTVTETVVVPGTGTAYARFYVRRAAAPFNNLAIGDLRVQTPAVSGLIHDGHPDLVGTGERAARCGHKHHVLRDTAPTVADDWATAGYPTTTLWTQVDDLAAPRSIVGTWVLIDASTGAAVWSPFGSAAVDASDVSVVDSDDHYTGDDLEEILAEIGVSLEGLATSATDLSLSGSVSSISTIGTPAFLHFPGVTKMSDGRLLVVYRQATDHQTTHDGKIVGKIGTVGNDYAVMWGSQFTIYDDGSLDCRDPEVATLADGTLIVSFFTWDGTDVTGTPGGEVKTTRSTDLGTTWDTPVTVTSTFTGRRASSAKVVELPSGDLLMPIYGHDGALPHSAAVVTSTDGGDTWGSQATIVSGTVGDGNNWTEPYMILLADGRLHCLIREDTDGRIYRTTSSDGGATWATVTNVFGGDARPAHIQVQSGGLLHVSRADPFGDTIYRISTDYGVTWAAETVVDSAGTRNEYASIVQIDPYRYGVAYGIHNTDTDADIKWQLFIDSANLDIIARIEAAVSAAAGVSDHGALTGLADDDHTQYLNEARHDALDHDALLSGSFVVDAGTPTYDDTDPSGVEVSIASQWGIDSDDQPYFNSVGVTSGEEAALIRDPDSGAYLLRSYNF